jgi:hypothetical protein
MLMVNQPQFVYDVVAMTTLATLGMLFYGLFLVRPLLAVIRIPRSIIMPVIFVLCTVGAFAIASRVFDIWLMVFIGVCCFVLRRCNYPIAPFVLGAGLAWVFFHHTELFPKKPRWSRPCFSSARPCASPRSRCSRGSSISKNSPAPRWAPWRSGRARSTTPRRGASSRWCSPVSTTTGATPG